jgi:cell division protein FtsB
MTLARIRKLFLNRYTLVLVLALGWMLFFDQYSLRSKMEMAHEIEELEREKQYFQQQIKQLRDKKDLLHKDLRELERLARERYLMKRPGEDLYLLVHPEERKAAEARQAGR